MSKEKDLLKKTGWKSDVTACFKNYINEARQGIGLPKKVSPVKYLKEVI